MQCSTCGAESLPSEPLCARCAENAAPTAAPSVTTTETPETSSPRPFAQITPYSGPYPPPYVQISSSESQPGPINILSKWIGPVWSGVVLLCFLLNSNGSRAEHLGDAAIGGGVSLYFWIGLWAVVAVPAFLIYCATRPKPFRDRSFSRPRAKDLP